MLTAGIKHHVKEEEHEMTARPISTGRNDGPERGRARREFRFLALPSTIASRVEIHEGKTSPEELLAAAHATCW